MPAQLSEPHSAHIEAMFHYKDFVPDHSIERVVPTGHIFIIFELDGIPRHTFDNETLKPNATFTKVWISGQQKHYISISAEKNSEMFVIQFKTLGALPYFGKGIAGLNDRVVPAEEILGERILQLHEELLAAPDSQAKFDAATTWLNERFDPELNPPEELLEFAGTLAAHPSADISELAASYPKTHKHLISQFKQYSGLTPKAYHRILRFNDILQKVRQQQHIGWSDIAYQCGLSDQSHFIREFRHFSGFNPSEFIRLDFQDQEPNFFPLDREET